MTRAKLRRQPQNCEAGTAGRDMPLLSPLRVPGLASGRSREVMCRERSPRSGPGSVHSTPGIANCGRDPGNGWRRSPTVLDRTPLQASGPPPGGTGATFIRVRRTAPTPPDTLAVALRAVGLNAPGRRWAKGRGDSAAIFAQLATRSDSKRVRISMPRFCSFTVAARFHRFCNGISAARPAPDAAEMRRAHGLSIVGRCY